MPCKHKFHCGCSRQWLELHSSLQVCRFQLPTDGSKDSHGSRNNSSREERGDGEGSGNGRRSWVPVPWFFSGLFSMSRSGSGRISTSPSSLTPEYGSNSHSNEN
ncbi:hypothetical protein AAC387_Pa03g2301 [Persea americana]